VKSIPAISRVASGDGDRVAAGVGVGASVAIAAGCGDALGSTGGDDDATDLGALAGPHAETQSRTATRRRVLTRRSLPTARPSGPDFAVVPAEAIRISWRCTNATSRCEEREAQLLLAEGGSFVSGSRPQEGCPLF
jgi:hypothetical protein